MRVLCWASIKACAAAPNTPSFLFYVPQLAFSSRECERACCARLPPAPFDVMECLAKVYQTNQKDVDDDETKKKIKITQRNALIRLECGAFVV